MIQGAALAGLQKTCGGDWKKVKNIYFVKPDTLWADRNEAISLAKWREYINQQDSDGDLRIWGGRILNSYEPTTADPTEVTFDSGRKTQTDRPKPSVNVMMDLSFRDAYMLFNSADGQCYDIVYELLDGTLYFEKLSSGAYKGQSAKIFSKTKGANQPSDVGNNVMVSIYFNSYTSALAVKQLCPVGWTVEKEILDSSPIGWYLEAEGEYSTSTGIITVYVGGEKNVRTGLDAADFVIKKTNSLDTPAVTTATDNGDGTYDLTLQKGAVPANLAVGDYMVLQVQEIDTGIVKEISTELTVIVKS